MEARQGKTLYGHKLGDARQTFGLMDRDGNGYVSQQEFFTWTLTVAADEMGTGLEAVFRRYDATGEGVLDAKEFALACEDMGFVLGSLGLPVTQLLSLQ